MWSDHDLAQLNNPLGGILRGGEAIVVLFGPEMARSLGWRPAPPYALISDLAEKARLGIDESVCAAFSSGRALGADVTIVFNPSLDPDHSARRASSPS